jgi:hypothetical protein
MKMYAGIEKQTTMKRKRSDEDFNAEGVGPVTVTERSDKGNETPLKKASASANDPSPKKNDDDKAHPKKTFADTVAVNLKYDSAQQLVSEGTVIVTPPAKAAKQKQSGFWEKLEKAPSESVVFWHD